MDITMNSRQERFCREYVIDLNATQAAVRAGYSKKSAANAGSENLKKPDLAAFIHKLKSDTAQNLQISAERVVRELACCGLANVQDYINPDGKPKDINQLTREQAAAIQEVKAITRPGDGQITHIVKLVDKRASLVDLGRHIGIFEADNAQLAEAAHSPAADLQTARLLAFAIQKAASTSPLPNQDTPAPDDNSDSEPPATH